MNWNLIFTVALIEISSTFMFLWLAIIWLAVVKLKMEKNWQLQLKFQEEMHKLQSPDSDFANIVKGLNNDQS